MASYAKHSALPLLIMLMSDIIHGSMVAMVMLWSSPTLRTENFKQEVILIAIFLFVILAYTRLFVCIWVDPTTSALLQSYVITAQSPTLSI